MLQRTAFSSEIAIEHCCQSPDHSRTMKLEDQDISTPLNENNLFRPRINVNADSDQSLTRRDTRVVELVGISRVYLERHPDGGLAARLLSSPTKQTWWQLARRTFDAACHFSLKVSLDALFPRRRIAVRSQYGAGLCRRSFGSSRVGMG